jgi:putative toxin-antitoxin system antitoxin component (TIGR02293 family)
VVQEAAQRITYDRVRTGLDVADVAALISEGIMTSAEVHKVVPARTLARRKARREPLTVQESDGIARLVRVAAQAARVFDDPELRSAWLRTGNPALGGERPVDVAITDVGARRVETVLNRIAWGDYS